MKALALLGQCFMERGMFDMAVSQIEKALENKSTWNDDRKELIYILANIYERQGKPDEAAAQYKSIYEVDIRYRDVAQKVESGY